MQQVYNVCIVSDVDPSTQGSNNPSTEHKSLAFPLHLFWDTIVLFWEYYVQRTAVHQYCELVGSFEENRIRRNVWGDRCTFGHFISELPVKIMSVCLAMSAVFCFMWQTGNSECTFTLDLYSPNSVRTEYTMPAHYTQAVHVPPPVAGQPGCRRRFVTPRTWVSQTERPHSTTPYSTTP
jgi:hypothetical protein